MYVQFLRCCIILVMAQCEVKCDHVTSYSEASYERYGPIPDGTPCTVSGYFDSFVEKNDLLRISGRQGLCVQGYCRVITTSS